MLDNGFNCLPTLYVLVLPVFLPAACIFSCFIIEIFEEWNPDPEIADPTHRFYGHIDYLELKLSVSRMSSNIFSLPSNLFH